MGRDKFSSLLRRNNLLIRQSGRRARMTDSKHWLKKYPNLVKLVEVTKSHEIWVSDITCISTKRGFSYLSLITDAYSRKIVGYYLSRDLRNTGSLEALKIAIRTNWRAGKQLIHHSDRGVQYCSWDYVEMLRSHEILVSMTENGDPYENAIAERVNGVLKAEFGLAAVFEDHDAAELAVARSVAIYNLKRPHSSCDYLTPAEAHEAEPGTLKRRWKSYYKKKPKTEYDKAVASCS